MGNPLLVVIHGSSEGCYESDPLSPSGERILIFTYAENYQMTGKESFDKTENHREKVKKMLFRILHYTSQFHLEDIKSPLDIFHVLSSREDDLS